MGAHNIEGVGEFEYSGSYPLGNGGPIIGHIYTSVEKLTTAGIKLLNYAAGKVRGVESASLVVGTRGAQSEIRVMFVGNIKKDEARKRLCRTLISVFEDACNEHRLGLESEPITCERRFTEETRKRMDLAITRQSLPSN